MIENNGENKTIFKETTIQLIIGIFGSMLAPLMIFHALCNCYPYKMTPYASKFSSIGYLVWILTVVICAVSVVCLRSFLRGPLISIFQVLASPIIAWVFYKMLMSFYSIELPQTKPTGDFSLHIGLEQMLADHVLNAGVISFVFVLPISFGISIIYKIREKRG